MVAGLLVLAGRRRLADDDGQFLSNEEMADYEGLEEGAALATAREAEKKAAEGGPDSARWRKQATEARLRSLGAGDAKHEYQARAAINRVGG